MTNGQTQPEHFSSGATTSLWMAASETGASATPASLTGDLHVDVCVVGAGIAGLTTAYLLARHGRQVAVLDDGPIGGGETGRTTAHLSNAIDDRYTEMVRLHGEQGARLAAESHSAAIDLIERIVSEEGIDCDFLRVDGYLILAPGKPPGRIDRELEAAHRAGLADVEKLDRPPLEGFTGPCLRFPRQAQFHPMQYLQGVAQAFQRLGGQIYTRAHVDQVSADKDDGQAPVRAVTSHGPTVTAQAAVVATNSPINDRVLTHLKQSAYRTYVIGAPIPRGAVPLGLYWDTLDPYHYVRLHPGAEGDEQDILLIGGEDHKTGQAEDWEERWLRLEAWARAHFPALGPVAYRWSGQVMETVDGLAFIGRTPTREPNIYIATGDSGMGMTHGAIAGILLSSLILQGDHPWATLYDPLRLRLGALGELAREDLNEAWQYKDLITPGEVASVAEIAPGMGAVLRQGREKIAVYRDAQGALHARSAYCTHLGCVVTWNAVEKSWDCPCHGSRFDAYGQVVNGPAPTDLAEARLQENSREQRE
ncbi:MAG TPA: FAD-dependent oxidoreductase [Caldilineaceae bacterium]|nr:FAD-dependent oxidoreductase [Caldilineaceae bacterium]